ncbi:MAG TPA: porin family protein [Flavobacteriaceae bacterium]|nr:porin family protein [Flavobacteriaceae bacterium]
MKRFFLMAAVAVFGFSVSAQEVSFGVTGGFLSGSQKVESGGFEATASESGFYIGGVADISVSEKFHVQPEVVFASIKDFSSIQVPIMAKYYVAEGLNLQAGPQIGFHFEETGDDFSSFNFSLGAGAGYDIDENFFVEARYAFQLNDYYTGDADASSKINFLSVGVGYKF